MNLQEFMNIVVEAKHSHVYIVLTNEYIEIDCPVNSNVIPIFGFASNLDPKQTRNEVRKYHDLGLDNKITFLLFTINPSVLLGKEETPYNSVFVYNKVNKTFHSILENLHQDFLAHFSLADLYLHDEFDDILYPE